MDCREAQRLADMSLDGEVEPTDRLDVDAHLSRCEPCRSAMKRELHARSCIRARLLDSSSSTRAPSDLRDQVLLSLQRDAPRCGPRWGRHAALAVTAVLVAGVALSGRSSSLDPSEPVLRHASNLPPEVDAYGGDAEVAEYFMRHLRYPVQVPRFEASRIRLLGGRLSSISNRDAAQLIYEDRGARISMFVYPGRIEKPAHFTEHQIRERSVLAGQHRGYNVVVWAGGPDQVHALVSNVDREELLRLASFVR